MTEREEKKTISKKTGQRKARNCSSLSERLSQRLAGVRSCSLPSIIEIDKADANLDQIQKTHASLFIVETKIGSEDIS